MKSTYLKNKVESNKHNMKKTWQTLYQVIGKSNNKMNFPNTFEIGNQSISDRGFGEDIF